MTSWLWGSAQSSQQEYDALLSEVSSEDAPTPDLVQVPADTLEISLKLADLVRSGQVRALDAVKSYKKRILNANPNVQLLALLSLDVAIKNSGDAFLREVANGSPGASTSTDSSLVDALGTLARGANHEVRSLTLRLLQNWATAFESKAHLAISQLVLLYRRLKVEGCSFPPRDLSATAAMIDSMAAPEWTDSPVCSRCREAFTLTNRRHHCRNCGEIFDQKCSSKMLALPHYGIQQEVRVCDGCYKKVKAGRRSSLSAPSSPQINSHSRSMSVRSPTSQWSSRSPRIREDDDLQLALRLSLAEAQPSNRPGYRAPSLQDRQKETDDPEMAAAIEASLREHSAPQPSAPVDGANVMQASRGPAPVDLAPIDRDALFSFTHSINNRQHSLQEMAPAFDRAIVARAHLVKAVGDASRRQRALNFSKNLFPPFIRAVKLYDGLLERQVARHSMHVASSGASINSLGQQQVAPTDSADLTAYSPPLAFASPGPSATSYSASRSQLQSSNHRPLYPQILLEDAAAYGNAEYSLRPPTASAGDLPYGKPTTFEHRPPETALRHGMNMSVVPAIREATPQTALPDPGERAPPTTGTRDSMQDLRAPKTYSAAQFPNVPTNNPWTDTGHTQDAVPELIQL